MKKRFLTCDECGAEWQADYGNTWNWQGKHYDSRQCYADAVARWKITHSTTEDADAPDAEAVATLAKARDDYSGA